MCHVGALLMTTLSLFVNLRYAIILSHQMEAKRLRQPECCCCCCCCCCWWRRMRMERGRVKVEVIMHMENYRCEHINPPVINKSMGNPWVADLQTPFRYIQYSCNHGNAIYTLRNMSGVTLQWRASQRGGHRLPGTKLTPRHLQPWWWRRMIDTHPGHHDDVIIRMILIENGVIWDSKWDQYHALRMFSWWRHQMEAFPRRWPFVRGIHRSPVDSPHKGQWRWALMLPLMYVWTNDWANNRDGGDLRRQRVNYDVTVM